MTAVDSKAAAACGECKDSGWTLVRAHVVPCSCGRHGCYQRRPYTAPTVTTLDDEFPDLMAEPNGDIP